MTSDQQEPTNPAKARIRHYADILNPLFWHDDFYRIDRFFELVCTMVRASGMKDTGWESHYESLTFSPCVEVGSEPVYAEVPGSTKRPYWPNVMQAYEL